jgi:4-carboxymuconolactone decarboxylase
MNVKLVQRQKQRYETKMNNSRIPPLPLAQFSDEQRAVAGAHSQYNFARVMVHHSDLYRAYIPFAEKLMGDSNLPLRDREILILRTLTLCDESYDLGHHRHIAHLMGMGDEVIAAACAGFGDSLPVTEQLLVRVAEELVVNRVIGDDNWQELSAFYSRRQMMELVFLVGNYAMMAMATRSFGIAAEGE